MKKFRLLVLLTCISLLGSGLVAQDLVLNLTGGETTTYPIQDIRSIKFLGNDMVIIQNDGTAISVDIATILSYQFDLDALSAPQRNGAKEKLLKIYPNPASDLVQIAYAGKESAELIIEIIDRNGRPMENLYQGSHAVETNVVWRPGAAAKGIYLCRVMASDQVITKKIIVQ